MEDFLKRIGARKRGFKYILDEFDTWFYLIFDTEPSDDNPENTAHVYCCPVGDSPDSQHKITVISDGTQHDVIRFILGLGLDRFSPEFENAILSYVEEYTLITAKP